MNGAWGGEGVSSGGLDSAHPACARTLCPQDTPRDPPDGLLTAQSRSLGSRRLRPFCDCPPRCVSALASVWGFYLVPFSLPGLAGFIWSICLSDAAGVRGHVQLSVRLE